MVAPVLPSNPGRHEIENPAGSEDQRGFVRSAVRVPSSLTQLRSRDFVPQKSFTDQNCSLLFSPIKFLNFSVHTITEVTSVATSVSEKFASLFRRRCFDAPFFRSRHKHGGVEHLQCGFGFSSACYSHGKLRRINGAIHFTRAARVEQIANTT